MVNQHLTLRKARFRAQIFAPSAPKQSIYRITAPSRVHDGAKMSELGAKDAKPRYEIPSDLSVHEFVRRAVAEARLAIAEFEKAQTEMDAPKLA